MRKYKFFYHYNKPASQKHGEMRMSVHFRNTCHIAKHVKCDVSSYSKERNRQPRCVMEGYASDVRISKDTIIIS